MPLAFGHIFIFYLMLSFLHFSVFDDYTCKVPIGSKTLQLSLWDTAGQEDFDAIRPMSYPGTNVFLLCFAVNKRDTFKNVTAKWVGELKQHAPKVPILLLGTKCDLRQEPGEDCISPAECEKLAKQIGAFKYDEVSAMKNIGVKQAFEDAIRKAIDEEKSGCSIL